MSSYVARVLDHAGLLPLHHRLIEVELHLDDPLGCCSQLAVITSWLSQSRGKHRERHT
jgi:hypothetical protein